VYNTNKCARMVRQFIYLPPDHFVIFDRVTSRQAEYPKTWLLHTANEPAIAGQEFRADQTRGGSSAEPCCGGRGAGEDRRPGREFWPTGKTGPSPTACRSRGRQLVEAFWAWLHRATRGDGPLAGGGEAGQGATEDCFLHLIQVSDQTVEKMAGSKCYEKDGKAVFTFTTGARTCTVTLNKTGAIAAHPDRGERQALVDQDLTQKVQPRRAWRW